MGFYGDDVAKAELILGFAPVKDDIRIIQTPSIDYNGQYLDAYVGYTFRIQVTDEDLKRMANDPDFKNDIYNRAKRSLVLQILKQLGLSKLSSTQYKELMK